jgi:large subunit ribosomal protein L35Ae
MKGRIASFRGSIHSRVGTQLIIKVDGVSKRADAQKLVGKKVVWKNTVGKQKKELKGEVRSAHGNSGAIRVLFETGMPGQCLSKEVEIL